MGNKTKEIKDELEAIQLDYDMQGYLSTNQADDIINHCNWLIREVTKLKKENRELKDDLAKRMGQLK